MAAKPRILVVDDQPDSAETSVIGVLSPDDVVVEVRHPRDITIRDLRNCAVVAVDHYLDDWAELDSQIPAMSPRDGFALAAVLRSQVPAGSRMNSSALPSSDAWPWQVCPGPAQSLAPALTMP